MDPVSRYHTLLRAAATTNPSSVDWAALTPVRGAVRLSAPANRWGRGFVYGDHPEDPQNYGGEWFAPANQCYACSVADGTLLIVPLLGGYVCALNRKDLIDVAGRHGDYVALMNTNPDLKPVTGIPDLFVTPDGRYVRHPQPDPSGFTAPGFVGVATRLRSNSYCVWVADAFGFMTRINVTREVAKAMKALEPPRRLGRPSKADLAARREKLVADIAAGVDATVAGLGNGLQDTGFMPVKPATHKEVLREIFSKPLPVPDEIDGTQGQSCTSA